MRAVLYALSANFGIFVAKATAAWITGSSSMLARSEERRVGKECRSRWSPYH